MEVVLMVVDECPVQVQASAFPLFALSLCLFRRQRELWWKEDFGENQKHQTVRFGGCSVLLQNTTREKKGAPGKLYVAREMERERQREGKSHKTVSGDVKTEGELLAERMRI